MIRIILIVVIILAFYRSYCQNATDTIVLVENKSKIYFLLPERKEGFAWDLSLNNFSILSNIDSLETGKEYIHQRP